MLHRDHESCVLPDDPATKAWRYVDLAKFLDLIQRSKLVLVRLDQFDDTMEGRQTDAWKKALWSDVGPVVIGNPEHERTFQKLDEWRKALYAQCWHLSEYDSFAMWRLYGAGTNTIAIQSTVGRIVDVIGTQAHFGRVSYIDYSKDSIAGKALATAYHKRHHFAHEQECRIVLRREPVAPAGMRPIDCLDDNPRHIAIECDLARLLSAIYLPPGSPEFLVDVIKNLLNVYKLGSVAVHKSGI